MTTGGCHHFYETLWGVQYSLHDWAGVSQDPGHEHYWAWIKFQRKQEGRSAVCNRCWQISWMNARFNSWSAGGIIINYATCFFFFLFHSPDKLGIFQFHDILFLKMFRSKTSSGQNKTKITSFIIVNIKRLVRIFFLYYLLFCFTIF